ncbi:60S ribosomal protein L12-like [Apodemus sylvaticus]|uniref:60S ribosomal protein L12-like n=1 Tax=Apodemus sylvaticus TaxID=10129 RepID=UPI002241C058|nr:60S ribosomal protein L12-like [Apodemus sylvaticus]
MTAQRPCVDAQLSSIPKANLNSENKPGSAKEEAAVHLLPRSSHIRVPPTPAGSTMPSKFDPTEVKITYLRYTGGDVSTHICLGLPNHHLGLSPKKVGDDTAKATGDWKGLRVTVKLTIQDRQAQAEVVPSASALVIKALKEPPRDRNKQNTTILGETVITVWQTLGTTAQSVLQCRWLPPS